MDSFIDSHNLAVTTLQNDYLSTVDMSRGRKQPVRMIRESQYGGCVPRAQTASAQDQTISAL